MNFFRKVNQMSYKTTIGLAIFLTVLLSVPLAVFLMSQETKIDSQAAYEKPEKATEPKPSAGPIPEQIAEIGRVFPWVGKIGDVVWIQGNNFGINPKDKELIIGGVVVDEEDINAWNDNLIEAVIPEGARQGGVVEIRIGQYPYVKSLPYVLYDKTTDLKLGKRDGKIIVDNGSSQVDRVIIWIGDDEIAEERYEERVVFAGDSRTVVFEVGNLPIKSLLLFDDQGKLLPYYVSVVEFDF